jgi:hypothetical protein
MTESLSHEETTRLRRVLPQYTLDELLAQRDFSKPMVTDEDRAWLDVEPVGREIIRCGPDDEFPGWLKLAIWLGLGALCWTPIIGAIYLTWRLV